MIVLTIVLLVLLIFGMYKIEVISMPKFLEDLFFKDKTPITDVGDLDDDSILSLIKKDKVNNSYEVSKIEDISFVDAILSLQEEKNYSHNYEITYFFNNKVRNFVYEVTSSTDINDAHLMNVKIFENDDLVNYYSFDGKNMLYSDFTENATEFSTSEAFMYEDFLGKTSINYLKNIISQMESVKASELETSIESSKGKESIIKSYEINHVRTGELNYLQIILLYSELNQKEELLYSVEQNIFVEARSYLNDELYFTYNNISYIVN